MRRLYTLLFCTVMLGGIANAQIGSPAPWASSASKEAQTLGTKPSPGTPSGSPTNAPIDGGLGILIAAGVLYGGRAYHARKKAGIPVM